MANKIDDGGPAFPYTVVTEDKTYGVRKELICPGMSLRAWLAGMALQGMLEQGFLPNESKVDPQDENCFTKAACVMADNLIAQLKK
jgi:hypothetical protein